MVVVIFEVWIQEGGKEAYLKLASALKAELSKIEGFVSIERFQSLVEPDKLLSLSVWANEEAVRNWRNVQEHREAQADGRTHVFKDYRIRVGTVIRDYGLFNRKGAPDDSKNWLGN